MGEGQQTEQSPTELDKMKILEEKGMISFDVELTPEEREDIQEIKIEKELKQFNYYGPANEKLIRELNTYFGQLENNPQKLLNTISGIVAKAAQDMQKEFNKESVWTMVRVTLPTHEFDIPRWHTDGKYFTSNEKTYKLVFTIKGASTRFAEKTDPDKFEELTAKDPGGENTQIKKELETTVQETEPISKDKTVIYLVGDKNAKVHSEPIMDESRIFISVVPGSLEQIEELKKRWEEE